MYGYAKIGTIPAGTAAGDYTIVIPADADGTVCLRPTKAIRPDLPVATRARLAAPAGLARGRATPLSGGTELERGDARRIGLTPPA